MFERICPNCNVPMFGDRCIKKSCGSRTITSSTIYWCRECQIPVFERSCPICGNEGKYVSTDIRPVFPEERLLLGVLLDENVLDYFVNKSVWYGGNAYLGNFMIMDEENNNNKNNKPLVFALDYYDNMSPNHWMITEVRDMLKNDEYSRKECVGTSEYYVPKENFFVERKNRLLKYFKALLVNRTLDDTSMDIL